MQPIDKKTHLVQEQRADPTNPYLPQDQKPAPRAQPAKPDPQTVPRGATVAGTTTNAGHAMHPMQQPRITRPQHLSYSSNIKPMGQLQSHSVQELFGQRLKKAPQYDPAPSRARYKLQRLWLTPIVRKMLKASIPVMGLCTIGIYLATNQQLRDDWSNRMIETRKTIETRPEFMVNLMKIQGVSPEIQEQVRTASGISLPLTSFDLDVLILRKRIEALDQVKSASLHLRSGGVLDVTIEERKPAILWRTLDGIQILDANGVRAGVVKSRLDRPTLPLIAGDGANLKIDEALHILKTAEPIKDRVRGLLRVGDRRWDLVLNRAQTIQLPAENPIAAVQRLIAWQSTQAVLSRDVTVVDLRNPARPYIRLAPNAIDQLRKVSVDPQLDETKL